MKRNYLLLFIGIGITINSMFGQTNENHKKNFYLTFNLTSPTLSYSPKWNIGFYKDLTNRLTIGGEIGYGSYGTSINFAADGDWIEKDFKIFEFSPELIYILKPNSNTKKFISSNLFYIKHSDNLNNRTYRNEKDKVFYNYDSADYRRDKFGINFNYGMIINFSNQIGIIPKIGLGIKMRSVNFSNVVNAIKIISDENENGELVGALAPNRKDFLEIEGFNTSLNFNFDIKIFYKFK